MLHEVIFEIKDMSEDGRFSGIASVYGNVDQQQDRIEQGAFAEDSGKEVPVLWTHQQDTPIGLGTLTDEAGGVRVDGKLDLETQAGREAYSRLKKGIVKGLSIGFELAEHAFEGAVRVIRKGIIREVSLVLFPANPRARVTAVKAGEPCHAPSLLRYARRTDWNLFTTY